MTKTSAIQDFLDDLSKVAFGRVASSMIAEGVCVRCGKTAVDFRDNVSYREFRISGMCQDCQDEIFMEEK